MKNADYIKYQRGTGKFSVYNFNNSIDCWTFEEIEWMRLKVVEFGFIELVVCGKTQEIYSMPALFNRTIAVALVTAFDKYKHGDRNKVNGVSFNELMQELSCVK